MAALKCKKPYVIRGMECPCNKCMACRFNKRRVWTTRMLLESMCHPHAAFITLTYKDLPPNGSLEKTEFQNFIKRLRQQMPDTKLRFFGVGEYGDSTQRPHYHAIIFGLPLDSEQHVSKAWGRGHTMVADCNQKTIQYVAGYCVKKMTSKDDPRLKGRAPEFALMSRRPGLGYYASIQIIESLIIANIGAIPDDVPVSVTHYGKKWPLGRYMLTKMRDYLGIEDNGVFKKWKLKKNQRLQEVFEKAKESSLYPQMSVQEIVRAEDGQRTLNFETRQEINKKKGTL